MLKLEIINQSFEFLKTLPLKHSSGVLLATADYERLQYLEDLMWGWRAKEAQQSGYLPDAVMALQQLLQVAEVEAK